MSGLAALLAGKAAGRLPVARGLRRRRRAAHRRARRAGASPTSTGSGSESVPELHAALADALGFPSYYGRNLDALADCLPTCPPTPCCSGTPGACMARAEPRVFARRARGAGRADQRAAARRGSRGRRPVAGLDGGRLTVAGRHLEGIHALTGGAVATVSRQPVAGAPGRPGSRRPSCIATAHPPLRDRPRQPAQDVACTVVEVGLVERGDGDRAELGDHRLDLGAGAGVVDDGAQPLDVGGAERGAEGAVEAGRRRRPGRRRGRGPRARCACPRRGRRRRACRWWRGRRRRRAGRRAAGRPRRGAGRTPSARPGCRARRRPGRRRRAADARSSTWPTCSAAPSWRRRRRHGRGPGPRRRGTARR